MNREQKSRQRFVDRRLQPLIQAASANDVCACDYLIYEKQEYVRVRFRSGFGKRICVEGMSLAELSIACLSALR